MAHRLLTKIYPESGAMIYAFGMMANMYKTKGYKVSSKTFARLREMYKQSHKGSLKPLNQNAYGMLIVKDLGMKTIPGNTDVERRYAKFLCPTCTTIIEKETRRYKTRTECPNCHARRSQALATWKNTTKIVAYYKSTGKKYKDYISIHEAKRDVTNNLSGHCLIHRALNNNKLLAYGYRWRYVVE